MCSANCQLISNINSVSHSIYSFQKSTYECSQATSAGSDLELSIEIPDSSGGEKALHQQQHSKHKESSCKAIDDVLQDVNTVERIHTHKYLVSVLNYYLFSCVLKILIFIFS